MKNDNFEYKMSKEMANTYLKDRKGEERKKHPQKYLCEIINNEFGMMGTCTRVTY